MRSFEGSSGITDPWRKRWFLIDDQPNGRQCPHSCSGCFIKILLSHLLWNRHVCICRFSARIWSVPWSCLTPTSFCKTSTWSSQTHGNKNGKKGSRYRLTLVASRQWPVNRARNGNQWTLNCKRTLRYILSLWYNKFQARNDLVPSQKFPNDF